MAGLDTLGMVGDGDDLDILRDVEQMLGVSVSDHEAACAMTVGDLHRIVAGKLSSTSLATACFSQIAFHRLRKAATDLGVEPRLRPADDIRRLFADCRTRLEHRRRWAQLERSSGLTLPMLEPPSAKRSGNASPRPPRPIVSPFWLVGVSTLAFLVHLLGGWIAGGVVVCAVFGSVLLDWVRATVPTRIKTVGDLAEEAAGASFRTLYAEKRSCHPNDIWFAVVAVCRNVSLHRGEIHPSTTFFADDARQT